MSSQTERQGSSPSWSVHGVRTGILDYTTVFYHFERYVARARQAKPKVFAQDSDPITIHRLRAGVSLAAVRKLLGHQNLQTALRSAEIDLTAIKQELVAARGRAKAQ
jgi:integrase